MLMRGKKSAESKKKFVIKRKLRFKDYKHYLEANELENKINQLVKNKLDVNGLGESNKEFIH